MTARSLVSVVDDDESVRESLPDLLTEFGYQVSAYASARAFLDGDCVVGCECLILDIAMPEMTGPQLLRELRGRGHQVPVIFITAQCEEEVATHPVENGAVACLLKPFSQTALLDALHAALSRT
jgi:FixJ family two-component response regulator